jgi:hypothetical protein
MTLFKPVVIAVVYMVAFPSLIYSQGLMNLSAKVLDKDTGMPIGNASVRLTKEPVGTLTNDDGEFNFNFVAKSADDTLIVSMMGYESFRSSLNNTGVVRGGIVYLAVKPIELREIVVSDTKLDALEIIKKANANIERNLPVEPYSFRTFYRETHLENNRNVILTEAVADVFDPGYKPIRRNGFRFNEKIVLKQVRSSSDYRDSLFRNTVIERYNLLISAFIHNPVKYLARDLKKVLANSTLSFDSVLSLNDRLVYVVSFKTYIPRYPLFERKNTLYIDAEDYAIEKYTWEEYPTEGEYSEPGWPLTPDSVYFVHRKRIETTYEYEEHNGRMFLKYFDEKCFEDIRHERHNNVKLRILGHTTIIASAVQANVVKPEKGDLMMNGRSVYAQPKPYDAGFWKHNKPLVPLTRKQIRDLEWKLPLEQQYVSSGGRK